MNLSDEVYSRRISIRESETDEGLVTSQALATYETVFEANLTTGFLPPG